MSKTTPIGARFGDWKVIGPIEYVPHGTWQAQVVACRCKCGHVQKNQQGNLIYGRTKRCHSCAKKRQAELAKARARRKLGRRFIDRDGASVCVKCPSCRKPRWTLYQSANNKCRDCAAADKSGTRECGYKFKTSTGRMAERLGITRQAVHLCIQKNGREGAVRFYREKYGIDPTVGAE